MLRREGQPVKTAMLVVFSGIDGAGKTTQIGSLEEYLLSRKIRTYRAWARGGYTPIFEFLKRLLRRVAGRRLGSAGQSVQRERAMARPTIARLWLRVASLDLILFWGVYLRLLGLLGRTVICDRYIDDTRLDFRRNFPTVAFEEMWLWRLLERVVPTPDAAFLLWVPVEESLRRSKEKGEPFPDDEDTLTWRLEAYLDNSLYPPDRYVRLDGRRAVSELTEAIISTVGERLGKSARIDGG